MRVPRAALIGIAATIALFLLGHGVLSTARWSSSPPNAYLVAYGRPRPKALDDPTFVATIPNPLLPAPGNNRRLVVVGDIHGMYNELEQLLQKVEFNPDMDHLITTGDVVNKGPDSAGVVKLLMEVGASGVRGNHENSVLMAVAEQAGDRAATGAKEKYLAVARTLSEEQIDWLARLPLIITLTPHPITIAHAGLVPGVPLAEQDPWAVLNMRTLIVDDKNKARAAAADDKDKGKDVSKSSKGKEGDPVDYKHARPTADRTGVEWSDAWNSHQAQLKKDFQRRTVIYGHDAKRGYKEGKYTFGLDSDCVGGGALTAFVIESDEEDFKHHLVQVNCEAAKKTDEA